MSDTNKDAAVAQKVITSAIANSITNDINQMMDTAKFLAEKCKQNKSKKAV